MAGMPFAVPINRIMLPGVLIIYHENMAGEDAPSRRREVYIWRMDTSLICLYFAHIAKILRRK